MTVNQVLSVVLIALFPVGPWAMVIIIRGIRRDPAGRGLRQQLVRFAFSAVQALAWTVIAANVLLGMPLPRGVTFPLLVVIALLASAPPGWFLIDYYRR